MSVMCNVIVSNGGIYNHIHIRCYRLSVCVCVCVILHFKRSRTMLSPTVLLQWLTG